MLAQSHDIAAQTRSARTGMRISALDFEKGVLVLLMVVYHWLNYFADTRQAYRYLRFLTPSFIFITGFLISHVYLSKYDIGNPRLWQRLLSRGFKILAIFLLLNASRSLLLVDHSRGQFSREALIATYLTGNIILQGNMKAASFLILVPISYLLVISSVLLAAAQGLQATKYFKYVVHSVWLLFFVTVIALRFEGIENGYLELLSMGLLGMVLGYLPMDEIHAFLNHPYLIVSGYAIYLAALTVWGEVYLIQIVGVCLTLMLIYLLHDVSGEHARRFGAWLGRYSLVGYIGQIAVLQVLHKGVRSVGLRDTMLPATLITAVVLTVVVVWAVDRARAKAAAVERLYAAVFC